MQPHDRLFRAVFGQPEHAEGLLRSALPVAVAERVDWTTLQALSSNVIDAELRERYADLLFGVKLDGHAAFLLLLLEHQSTSDPLMPFRMLGYMQRIWENFLKSESESALLPPIIPIVCHHSRQGWTAPLAFRELLDLPRTGFEDLERHLPRFELVLDDISKASDDELRARVLTDLARAALIALTKVRDAADVLAVLWRFSDVFEAVVRAESGVNALAQVISYILRATEVSPEQLQPFFSQLGKGAEEAFMTGAQILMERGRAEGKAEGKAELLLRQLRIRYGELPESAFARLRDASAEDLDRWGERVLTAVTLDDVFAGG